MRSAALFFFVSLCCLAVCSPVSDLLSDVSAAKTKQQFKAVLESNKYSAIDDPYLAAEIRSARSSADWVAAKTRLEQACRTRSALESRTGPPPRVDPKASAKSILSDPKFRRIGESTEKSALARTGEDVGRSVKKFWNRVFEERNDRISAPKGASLPFLAPVVWTVLILGLVLFVAFFVWHFRVSRNFRSKTIGELAGDEPPLTADEWLVKAAELESQKQFREAVRCLYLASLIRLDEAGHLRFVRAETNWEHLARFEKNPNRPESVDLHAATKDFDKIWYGRHIDTIADVPRFREFYKLVLANMRGRGK